METKHQAPTGMPILGFVILEPCGEEEVLDGCKDTSDFEGEHG